MVKLFITPEDKIRTEIYIDYSSDRPSPIIEPNEDLLLFSDAFRGMKEDEKKETFRLLREQFEEAIKKEGVKKEWMEWKYWDYKTRITLERLATTENPITKETEIDPDKLNELKIKYLLLDWSFTDENGNKITLKRDKEGLVDESVQLVMSMESSVLMAFLAELNRKLYLSKSEGKKNRDEHVTERRENGGGSGSAGNASS